MCFKRCGLGVRVPNEFLSCSVDFSSNLGHERQIAIPLVNPASNLVREFRFEPSLQVLAPSLHERARFKYCNSASIFACEPLSRVAPTTSVQIWPADSSANLARNRCLRHGPASFRADLGLELGSNPPLNLSSNLACKHRLKCVL